VAAVEKFSWSELCPALVLASVVAKARAAPTNVDLPGQKTASKQPGHRHL
jgi:hypothetical protein